MHLPAVAQVLPDSGFEGFCAGAAGVSFCVTLIFPRVDENGVPILLTGKARSYFIACPSNANKKQNYRC
jgi:hypothetical protein